MTLLLPRPRTLDDSLRPRTCICLSVKDRDFLSTIKILQNSAVIITIMLTDENHHCHHCHHLLWRFRDFGTAISTILSYLLK